VRKSTVQTTFRLACLALATAAVLLAACAGTARGTGSSVFQAEQAVALTDFSLSRAGALVVIRYPAIIHADAEEPFFHAFSVNAIGGEVPPANRTKKVTTRIAQSVIAKSNYFVMSLFRELQKELPQDTVLLSPHIILWDPERGVYSRPILASEQIPSVVTVDFNVYSFPDTTAMMDSPPITFGDLVTPLFVLHSDRWLQPATNGLLLASDPLVGTSWTLSEEQAARALRERLQNAPLPEHRPLDFVAFLNRRGPDRAGVPLRPVGGSAGDVIAVEEYPVEKIQMDGALLQNLSADYARDPFAESFVRGAAARIKQTLNEVDHDKATFFALQAALARFDPELAVAFLARSGGESVRARLQLAEGLIEAERRFLSAQSLGIYEGTWLGDYGVKMRQMIQGEFRLLEDRRSAARKQNVTTALAALALAGSIYGATAGGAAGAAALESFSGVLVLGSIWAMSSTLETRAESAQMSEHFMALIAPALERQISVQMEWMESKERITAMGFAEFRNKTLTLYQARIRSLESQFSDDCVFRHPGFTVEGRWYGGCREGLAEGRGYGVIVDGAGNSAEYLGTARGGLADGTGGLIARYHNQLGAYYFEGSFARGLPDGAMLVEEPGRKARTREFRAGKDAGNGAAGDVARLAF
jgi:predicted small secreted protein